MKHRPSTRRAFLRSGIASTATLPFAGAAMARPDRTADFTYEITRTEEEWRLKLTDYEYEILRNSGTEWARSSAWWDDYREGEFSCKGCDLHNYSSDWRVNIDKGWVFFAHAQPTTVLTDIDKGATYSINANTGQTMIEAHCRRCGSHLGHILIVEGQLVHCINGAALDFRPTTG